MRQKLIDKFLEGQCSPAEVRAILKWYHSEEASAYFSEEIEKSAAEYREIGVSDGFNKEHVFRRIYTELQHDLYKNNLKETKEEYHPGWLHRAMNIAATLVFIVSIALITYKDSFYSTNPNSPSVPTYISKHTSTGQKTTIFLSDGTVINLNSASEIRYPDQFSVSEREVWLKGEAFFQVASDEKRPFTIHSGNISTTALGTSFNIRAYEEESEIKVVLKSGKIKITDHGKNTAIIDQPNSGIHYNHGSENWINTVFDPKSTFLWKDGILYFKNVGFEEMINQFESWYGVKFHVENFNKSQDKPFTVEYDHESLFNVLTGLSFSKGFTFQIQNEQVYIKFE